MNRTIPQKQNHLSLSGKFRFILTLFVFTLLSSQTSFGQVSNYVLNQLQITPAYTALPAAPTSTNLFATTGNIDNGVSTIALPFTFQFNGANYNSVNISMHGFLTFGATVPALTETTPISSATAYSGVVSAFAMDLDLFPASTTRNVAYYTIGSAGSRIFKVQWNVRRHNNTAAAGDSGGGNDTQFQIWLYETTNVIEMHYNTNTTGSTFNALGQIGLRGANNTDYKNLNYSSPAAHWPGVAPAPVGTMPLGTSNIQTVLLRNTSQIQANSNRLFRWTPVTCFAPTGLAVTAGTITNNAATITWSAAVPAPANGYEYYVTTSPIAPNAGTTPTGSTLAGVLTANLTGLTGGALQYVYVRSKCSGVDISSWSSVLNFTTLCNPVGVPYYQPFDGPVIPGVAPYHGVIPTCTSQQNVGLGNPWVTTDQDSYYPNANMDANILMYNGQNPGNPNPANVWWFTEGINLTAGSTYTLDYLYGGTSSPSTVQNKMKVAYGTYPSAAAMTTILDDHPDIKGSSFQNMVNFTAPSTGVYYFGFQAYSNANNGQLYVDDVQIYPSTCLQPTAVSVSSITGSTALLSWTAPSPAPSGGYAYYYSTSSTPPTNSTTPSGFTATGVTNVTLTGLAGLTTYYFWVRSNCGFGGFGEWVALNNSGNPYFTTLVQINYCASGSTGNQNYFTNFASSGAITNVSNPTGYAAGGYGNYTNLTITQAQNGTVTINTSYNDMTGGVGIAMWVDWNQDGTFDNATERVYNSAAYISVPPVVTFTVPNTATLGSTRMRIVVDWNLTSPNACGSMTRGETEDYSFLVVTPPPPLTLSTNTLAQCSGDTSGLVTITAGLSDYQTFTWSPAAGVSGTPAGGYTFTNATTQTYVLTATQTVSPFRFNTVSFTYVANPRPTPITISTPSGSEVCPYDVNPGIPLVATGGIVSGVPLLNENFNGATNSWTVVNNGGSASGIWTLRPDGYNQPFATTHSNDFSQYYLADSDTGLTSGTTVSTFLTSPSFSTVGYTQASLSFWHYYRYFSADTGKVQISTNGSTWTDLATYSSNQGTETSFQNVNISLNAYLGQPTVYIRFRYDANWDWGWGIDNVLVSGSAANSVVWNTQTAPVSNGTAVPGLFTNAAATVPYIAGTVATTVYANPAASTTFEASASTPAPVCSVSTPVSVTVNPINPGTASSNQSICSGAPAPLTLTGFTGTVINWQSADNLAFTLGVTTIPLSNSATLSSAQMGAVLTTKYYRATVTNGICTAYSNVVTITVGAMTTYNAGSWDNGVPDATKIAVFDDNYTSTGDLYACGVYVQSGNVFFNAGHNMVVTNAVNSTGGTLTFDDDSSLVQINSVANVGDIIYTCKTTPVNRFDYTYWSSPVAAQVLSNFSPLTLSDKYFIFNQTINNWQNVPGASLMDPGKGYIIRAPQSFDSVLTSVFTGQFIGVPNNGDIPTDIIVGPGTINLIGNPYPSAIDADLFLTDPTNDPIIQGAIYLWTHNTPIAANQYVFNDYAIYTLSGGIGTTNAPNLGVNNSVPNGNIAAGQGFMIEGAIPASTNSVYFRNSMRLLGNNNQFFRHGSEHKDSGNAVSSSLERHRVWLEVANNEGAYKQVLVGYIQNASNDFDKFDGVVFDTGNPVFLYTMVEGKQLGIQGKSLPFDQNDQIPLGFKTTLNGNFEIRLSDFDGLFENQNVYIEDLYLNVIHDLKASNYAFTTTSGTFENRFVLRFTNSVLANGQHVFDENSVVIYKDVADTIMVNASNTMLESVEIYDIRGSRLFAKKGINQTQYIVSGLHSSDQVLIVTATSDKGEKITKKIVF